MIALRFRPGDRKHIVKWLQERMIDPMIADDIPMLGYVAYADKTEPIAAGFLRIMEGSHAMLDSLVSNPRASSAERHEGIELVVKAILDTAKKMNIKKVLAYSIDDGTIKRSLTHGFKKLPHTLLGLELGAKHGIFKSSIGDKE